MQAPRFPCQARSRGFSVIELVMVLVIVGILAAEAWPRFASRSGFETRGFADQTRAAIEYARKLAMATGRNVCVATTAGSLTLTMADGRGRGAVCPTAVTDPATGSAYTLSAPGGDNYYSPSVAIKFYANGVASTALSLVVHGDPDITITIDGVTGYVR